MSHANDSRCRSRRPGTGIGSLIFAKEYLFEAPGIPATALVWRETAKMGPSSTSRGWGAGNRWRARPLGFKRLVCRNHTVAGRALRTMHVRATAGMQSTSSQALRRPRYPERHVKWGHYDTPNSSATTQPIPLQAASPPDIAWACRRDDHGVSGTCTRGVRVTFRGAGKARRNHSPEKIAGNGCPIQLADAVAGTCRGKGAGGGAGPAGIRNGALDRPSGFPGPPGSPGFPGRGLRSAGRRRFRRTPR